MKNSTLRLLLVACLFGAMCSACGGPSKPRLGIKIQLLDSAETQSIRFLDVAFFDGGKVDCGQITPTNYKQDIEPIKSARKKPILGKDDILLSLDVKNGKANRGKDLIDGKNFVIFVVALKLNSSNQKEPFASGCIKNVNFVKGKTTEVPIKLSKSSFVNK